MEPSPDRNSLANPVVLLLFVLGLILVVVGIVFLLAGSLFLLVLGILLMVFAFVFPSLSQLQLAGYSQPPVYPPYLVSYPPPYAPPAPPTVPTSPNCPRCGRPLTYVYQYQRWYCQAENLYPWG